MTFKFGSLFPRKSSSEDPQILPESIEIRIQDGVTVATYLNNSSVEETKQIIDYLGSKGIYQRRVWDLSKIDFPFTVEEMRELAYYGREAMGKANRIALVVKDTVGFGSSRAFATYREGDNVSSTRVFKSFDEAMQWVKEDS